MPGSPIGSFLRGFTSIVAPAIQAERAKKDAKAAADAKIANDAIAARNKHNVSTQRAVGDLTSLGLTPLPAVQGITQSGGTAGSIPQAGVQTVNVGAPLPAGAKGPVAGAQPQAGSIEQQGQDAAAARDRKAVYDWALNAATLLYDTGAKRSDVIATIGPMVQDFLLRNSKDPVYMEIAKRTQSLPLRLKQYKDATTGSSADSARKQAVVTQVLQKYGDNLANITTSDLYTIAANASTAFTNDIIKLRNSAGNDLGVLDTVGAMYASAIGSGGGVISRDDKIKLDAQAEKMLINAGFSNSEALAQVKFLSSAATAGSGSNKDSFAAQQNRRAISAVNSFVTQMTTGSQRGRAKRAHDALLTALRILPTIMDLEAKFSKLPENDTVARDAISAKIKAIREDPNSGFGAKSAALDKLFSDGGFAAKLSALRTKFGEKQDGPLTVDNEADRTLIGEIITEALGPQFKSSPIGDLLDAIFRASGIGSGGLNQLDWGSFVNLYLNLVDDNGELNERKIGLMAAEAGLRAFDTATRAQELQSGNVLPSNGTPFKSTQKLRDDVSNKLGL